MSDLVTERRGLDGDVPVLAILNLRQLSQIK